MAKYNPDIHHRRSIRFKNYDYSQPGAYFITIVTKNRECLFGIIENGEMVLNEYGRLVENEWYDLPNHNGNIKLDAFVVMPNHIHGIIFITENDNGNNVGAIHELPLHQQNESSIQRRNMLIPKIIGRFKMVTAKQINILRNTPGIPLWQRNYYEHILRNDSELFQIRQYIIFNPSNWLYDENYIG